jgi:hypothetical protein
MVMTSFMEKARRQGVWGGEEDEADVSSLEPRRVLAASARLKRRFARRCPGAVKGDE